MSIDTDSDIPNEHKARSSFADVVNNGNIEQPAMIVISKNPIETKTDQDEMDEAIERSLKKQRAQIRAHHEALDEEKAGIRSGKTTGEGAADESGDVKLKYKRGLIERMIIRDHGNYLSISHPQKMTENDTKRLKKRFKKAILHAAINKGWSEFHCYDNAGWLSKGTINSQMTALVESAKAELIESLKTKGGPDGIKLSPKERKAIEVLEGTKLAAGTTENVEPWRRWNPIAHLLKKGENTIKTAKKYIDNKAIDPVKQKIEGQKTNWSITRHLNLS